MKEETKYKATHLLKASTILQERYIIEDFIGEGGFGITYVGKDLKLDMKVAIKEYYPFGYAFRDISISPTMTILSQKQEEFIKKGKQNFLNESKILAKFNNEPGIVSVKDFFEENETAYIVMEYLEGQNLYEYLQEHTITEKEILDLFHPILDSLEKIHEAGIIHRDISPDNIMRLKDGRLKLMDFGAARLSDYTGQESVSIVLKSGYAPEEQYRPNAKLGAWTDIYALCATIYYCITKKKPIDALSRLHKSEMKFPSKLGFPISKQMEKVLKKGLSVKQENRYETIDELKKDLYKDEKKKERRKKGKKLIPILSLCLLFLLSAFSILGVKLANSDKIFQKRFHPKTMYHIALFQEDDMTDSQFHENVKIIKERLKHFAGKRNYITHQKEDMLEFYVNKEAFSKEASKEKGKKEILQQYLISETNLYLCSIEPKTRAYNTDEEDDLDKINRAAVEAERISISREDIESVKIKEGSVKGVEPKDYDITTKTYPYIEIILTDSFLDKNHNSLQKWTKNNYTIQFVQDMKANITKWEGYPMKTELCQNNKNGREYKTWKVFIEDLDYIDLVQFNWSHLPVFGDFDPWIDFENIIEWDLPAEKSADQTITSGEKQCSPSDFKEDTITLLYECTPQYRSTISRGHLMNMKEAFQMRLDAIEMPYALGSYKDGTHLYIAVKTLPGRITPAIAQLIGGNVAWYFQTDLSDASPYPHIGEIEKELTKDGKETYALYLEVPEWLTPDCLDNIEKAAKEAKKETMILTANVYSSWYARVSLLEANINTDIEYDPGENGNEFTQKFIIKFKNFAFSEEDGITKDSVWVLNFMKAIEESSNLLTIDFELHVENNIWRSKDGTPLQKNFIFSDFFEFEQAKNVTKKIKSIYKNADIRFEEGDSIDVLLDLPLNETFPEKSLELAEKIYKEIDFENTVFNALRISFTEQDDSMTEEVCLHFIKDYETAPKKGNIVLEGVLIGERFKVYEEKFKHLLNTDDFFKKYENRTII